MPSEYVIGKIKLSIFKNLPTSAILLKALQLVEYYYKMPEEL